MNWKRALSGPDRDKVIAAYDKEVKSLLSTILKRLGPDSTKYETAIKEAISGGEASAPIRWENTVAPWFEEQGFIRGDNEPCAFYHPWMDQYQARVDTIAGSNRS